MLYNLLSLLLLFYFILKSKRQGMNLRIS